MISCTVVPPEGVQSWDIAEIAFPEKAVIWELTVEIVGAFEPGDNFRIALGDQLPTTEAQMDALEPLFPGTGQQGPEPRRMLMQLYTGTSMRQLKMPIQASGRRMIVEVTPVGAAEKPVVVKIIVSSLPTEVPNWLISG